MVAMIDTKPASYMYNLDQFELLDEIAHIELAWDRPMIAGVLDWLDTIFDKSVLEPEPRKSPEFQSHETTFTKFQYMELCKTNVNLVPCGDLTHDERLTIVTNPPPQLGDGASTVRSNSTQSSLVDWEDQLDSASNMSVGSKSTRSNKSTTSTWRAKQEVAGKCVCSCNNRHGIRCKCLAKKHKNGQLNTPAKQNRDHPS